MTEIKVYVGMKDRFGSKIDTLKSTERGLKTFEKTLVCLFDGYTKSHVVGNYKGTEEKSVVYTIIVNNEHNPYDSRENQEFKAFEKYSVAILKNDLKQDSILITIKKLNEAVFA